MSKLLQGHCPKVVQDINIIKENKLLLTDLNQVIYCPGEYGEGEIYVFKDGKEEAKIKPSDIQFSLDGLLDGVRRENAKSEHAIILEEKLSLLPLLFYNYDNNTGTLSDLALGFISCKG